MSTTKYTLPQPEEKRDLSRPHCARVCLDPAARGSGSLTTIYLQEDGTYILATGTEVATGNTCPTRGPCASSGQRYCWNPHGGLGGISLLGQPDGSYVDEDGNPFDFDVRQGHIALGPCLVPSRCCWNPHNGTERTVWLQLDGSYNTKEDGTGDAIDIEAELGNLTEGRCKPVTTRCFYYEREIESLGAKGVVTSEIEQLCVTLYQHDDGTYLDETGNEFDPYNPPEKNVIVRLPEEAGEEAEEEAEAEAEGSAGDDCSAEEDSSAQIKGYFVDGVCDKRENELTPWHYEIITEPIAYCFNPHSGPEVSIWLQTDGITYLERFGNPFDPSAHAGDLTEGACKPVGAWCFAPGDGSDSITVQQMNDGTYQDDAGEPVDIATGTLIEGACAVDDSNELTAWHYEIGDSEPDPDPEPEPPAEPEMWCFNSWIADQDSVQVWFMDDGTYNTAADGFGDLINPAHGTLSRGECPDFFCSKPWCFNPHKGAPMTIWTTENGSYNTEFEGTGDVVDMTIPHDLIEGECPIFGDENGDDG